MGDVKRPTILTVLAILAIIGGVFGGIGGVLLLVGSIALLSTGFGGIMMLVLGVLSAGIGVLALIAGIKVMGNKAGGVDLMKKYAFASIGYQVLMIIYTLAIGGQLSMGGIVVGLAIGIAILVFLFTNDDVKAYADSLS